MNNKNLLLILLGLLAIYFGYQFFAADQERSFRSEVVSVDTDAVTQINLFPKAENFQQVTLTKVNDGWEVEKDNFKTTATASSVNSLLGQAKKIKAKRVASKNTEKWKEYEVDETSGSRVQFYANNKLLSDFMVGKFNMNQQARTFTSFIRLTDENEVYEVDGFLSSSFNQSMDNFRDKKFVQLNTSDITEFSIQNENGTQTFSKVVGNWSTSDGTPLDSTQVINYLNGLRNLNGQNFINNFQPPAVVDKSVTFKGNNMTEPVVVNCYVHQGEKPFVLQSNMNKAAYFLSDSSGVFKTLFDFYN